MTIDYRGVWYSPKFPEVRLSGVLKIQDDDIELTIYSTSDFRGKNVHSEDAIDLYRVIHGESQGHKITLLDCHLGSTDKVSNTLDMFTLHPEIVLDGRHYDHEGDIKFAAITCSYSFMSAWMENLERISDFEEIDTQLVDFDERLSKVQSIEINGGCMIEIVQFVREGDLGNRRKQSFQIHHTVNFKSAKVESFEYFKTQAHHFRRLIELGLDTTINIWFHEGISEDQSNKWIRIYHPQSKKIKAKTSDDFRARAKMLFSLYKLGEKQFKAVIQKWFETIPRFDVIYTYYLDSNKWFEDTGASLTSVMFNNRVLNIIQALESFHAIIHSNEDESLEDFKKQFDETVKVLSPEGIDWLKSRSQPLRKGLRVRVKELINEYGFVIGHLLPSNKEKSEFVSELLEIRNSLSHGRHSEPDLGIKNEALYHQARILLLTCILSTLGLDQDKIKKLIIRCLPRNHELGFCEHERKKRLQNKNQHKLTK